MFGLISALISGIVSPLFSFLSNKDTVTMQEYAALTEAERAVYASYAQAMAQTNASKVANNWAGAHFMVYLFGLPAGLHWAAVFLDSTFRFGWAVPALPGPYAGAEQQIALSFFILAPALPIISSVSQMLNRR
jgi:hypothetical protein